MFFILLLVVSHGRLSAAEEQPEPSVVEQSTTDELHRWVPSISISMGILLQRGSGSSTTSDIMNDGPLGPNPTPLIRPFAEGQDLMFAPIANVSLELMTPGLLYVPFVPDLEVPGRPRLFAHGDVAMSFAQEYDLAREGKPGEFILPGFVDAREAEIRGQGSTGQAQVDGLVFSAGAGIALTFDISGRRLRIKPSFEWLREKIVLEESVSRLVAQRIKVQFAPPITLDDFRQISLRASQTKVFQAIGGGLEFEVDANRAGPFLVSTFVGARVHRVIGDLNVEVAAINEFMETAVFRYKNRRWLYQGFMGIRVRFAPE